MILFKLLALISSIVFSNFGLGSNFAASILLFISIYSKFSSKYVGILEIHFSCTSNCDGNLTDISLCTSVDSERHSLSELIVTSYFSICVGSLCCCSMKYINSSYGCSKLWSYLSNLDFSLVSKQFSVDEVSELIVSTSF